MFSNKIYPINIKKENKKYESDNCPICLEELINELVMPCGHQFHTNCILDWFEKNKNCPICRIKLKIVKIQKNNP